MTRAGAVMAIGALLLLLAAGALSGSCGGVPPEGTSRPFETRGRAGIVTCEGTEVVRGGAWVKHGDFVFRDPESGEVTARGPYLDGLEHGPWEQTGEDGFIGRGHFERGQRTGEWTYAYPSGKTESAGSYREGRRHGTWRLWRRDGSVALEKDYDMGEVLRTRSFPPDQSPRANR